MSQYQKFEVARTVSEASPPRAIGYDIAQCVAYLFDKITYEGLDPSKADLSTLSVRRVEAGIVASIHVEDPRLRHLDRLNLFP